MHYTLHVHQSEVPGLTHCLVISSHTHRCVVGCLSPLCPIQAFSTPTKCCRTHSVRVISSEASMKSTLCPQPLTQHPLQSVPHSHGPVHYDCHRAVALHHRQGLQPWLQQHLPLQGTRGKGHVSAFGTMIITALLRRLALQMALVPWAWSSAIRPSLGDSLMHEHHQHHQ